MRGDCRGCCDVLLDELDSSLGDGDMRDVLMGASGPFDTDSGSSRDSMFSVTVLCSWLMADGFFALAWEAGSFISDAGVAGQGCWECCC